MTKFLFFVPASAFIASQADREARQYQATANCTQLTTEGNHWNTGPWRFDDCGQTAVSRDVSCANGDNCEQPPPPATSHCDEVDHNEPSCSDMPLCEREMPTWTPWSECTAQGDVCGDDSGLMTRQCDTHCDELDVDEKMQSQPCDVACTPTWNDWSECTAQGGVCGVGSGQMTRECDTHCDELADLTERQSCDVECTPTWNDWSECTAQGGVCGVGSGQMTRECDTHCDELADLTERQSCDVACTGTWELVTASDCSQCGTGVSTAVYRCSTELCNESDKPWESCTRTACDNNSCDSVNWDHQNRYDLASFAPIHDGATIVVACAFPTDVVQVDATCEQGTLTREEDCPPAQWIAEWSECIDPDADAEMPNCSGFGNAYQTATWTCTSQNEQDCGEKPASMRECWKEAPTSCPIVGQCMKNGKHRKTSSVPYEAIKQWMQARDDWEQFAVEQPEVFSRLPQWATEAIKAYTHNMDSDYNVVGDYDSQFKGDNDLKPEQCIQLCLQQQEFAEAMGWPQEWKCQSVAPHGLNNTVSGSCWMRNEPVYGHSGNLRSGRGKSIDSGCLVHMMDLHGVAFGTLFQALVNASDDTDLGWDFSY